MLKRRESTKRVRRCGGVSVLLCVCIRVVLVSRYTLAGHKGGSCERASERVRAAVRGWGYCSVVLVLIAQNFKLYTSELSKKNTVES